MANLRIIRIRCMEHAAAFLVDHVKRNREEIRETRVLWRTWQKHCDVSKLVFLDETGATTNMIGQYGRAKGGARCLGHVPGGHWQTMTFIAGLRADGLTAPG